MKDILISICVLNYNGNGFVSKFFASISKVNNTNNELIIVDNDSTDGSLTFIKKELSRYQFNNFYIVELNKNLGYAGGHNAGAKLAKGKYIFFLNIDTEVEPEFLDCIEHMENRSFIDICQPLIMDYETNIIQNMGMNMGYLGHLKILGKDRLYSTLPKGSIKEYKIFSVLGAAFCIKRSIFEELGGFDSQFFMYFEESDLCWRAQIKGYNAYFFHDPSKSSRVFHKSYGTTGNRKNLEHLFFRNRFISMLKNYQLRYFPFLIISLCIALVGTKSLMISTKGFTEALLRLPDVIKFRRKIKLERIRKDSSIISGIW